MNNLFVKVKEKQYGPFSKQELRDLVQEGKFSPRDKVWNADNDEWIDAEKAEELKQPNANHQETH